jgi:hypothetical protein
MAKPKKTETEKMGVVSIGNAFDGMTLYGPFPIESCVGWAEKNLPHAEWCVVELHSNLD